VPSVDIYDSWELVSRHMPIEQPPSTYDYIIFKKGTKIYAKNGKTGHIEYEDTDAATVIQDAIDALPEFSHPYGGGTICIKGTGTSNIYEITKKIVIDKPLRLVGDNRMGIVCLKAADGLNDRLLEVYKEDANFWTEISRLWFEGNKDNQTDGDYLIYINGGYPIMRDVFIMRAYHIGIRVNAQDCHFYNVYVEFSGYHGWWLNTSQNAQLYSCTAWNNGESGMMITSEKRWSLVNCRVMKNLGSTYDAAGLAIQGSGRGQIIGGYYNENQGPGIDLYNSNHIQIIGAMIRDNGQKADNSYDGIRIRGDSNHNVILGCTIYSTLTNKQRYGINEEDTADYNLVVGNIVHGNVTGQIHLIGTNSVEASNITS